MLKKNRKKVSIIITSAIVLIAVICGIIASTGSETEIAKTENTAVTESVAEKDKKTEKKADDKQKDKETADMNSEQTHRSASNTTSGDDSVKNKTNNTVNNTTNKNSSSSTSSSPNKNSNSSSAPSHTHSWKAVYKEVDAGYYDEETIKIAWTECHLCGADITANLYDHIEAHMDKGEVGSYGTSYRYETRQVWVPVTKTVVDYYKCSCGATK